MVTDTRFLLIDGGRYFYGLDLPNDVAQHSSIQQLGKLARELMIMCVHTLQVIND